MGFYFFIRALEICADGKAGNAPLVLPVVKAFEPRKGDIHIGGIAGKLVFHPWAGLHRVAQAAALPRLLLRLIKGREQQHEKAHVKIQRKAG